MRRAATQNTRRGVWKLRGSAAFRIPSKVVRCPHCHAHYEIAVDFERHDQGACVRERSAV